MPELYPRSPARQRQSTGSDALALLDLLSSQRGTSADSDDAKQNARANSCPPGKRRLTMDMDALRRFRRRRIARLIGFVRGSRRTSGQSQRAKSHRRRSRSGFARLSPEERKRIASMGGTTSTGGGPRVLQVHRGRQHPRGTKGARTGETIPAHLAEIGRQGGALLGYRKPSGPRRQAIGYQRSPTMANPRPPSEDTDHRQPACRSGWKGYDVSGAKPRRPSTVAELIRSAERDRLQISGEPFSRVGSPSWSGPSSHSETKQESSDVRELGPSRRQSRRKRARPQADPRRRPTTGTTVTSRQD